MSDMLPVVPKLYFEKGTIRIEGDDGLTQLLRRIPDTKYDDQGKVLRSYGLHYAGIIKYLQKCGMDFVDHVPNFIPSYVLQTQNLELRDYQKKAIQNWERSLMRGCVILPTGAGKTAIGITAIQRADTAALVIVPTIDLMDQWIESITAHLTCGQEMRIGRLGGGDSDIQAITVATYASAYIQASAIGDRFGLLIFDEVHHLPASGYRSIAEQFIAPYRLGLTATIEREDKLHDLIPYLVGDVVFRLGSQRLSSQKHLAEYDVKRIQVRLAPDEHKEYELNQSRFMTNLRKLGFKTPSMYNLRKVIMMSNRNRDAREAILARNRANEIALNSRTKVDELQRILLQNKGIKTIIFTQNNKMVYRLSDRFLIPSITYRTARGERRDVLAGFKSGKYDAVVTSNVLDEGVNVPDAELGVIMSGTGSGRELIQRLGRLLRPKHDGRMATLIELVSSNTKETGTSARRIAALRRSASQSDIRKGGDDAGGGGGVHEG